MTAQAVQTNTAAAAGEDRIEALLGQVRGMVSPPAWSRVEELIRALLELHRDGLSRALALLGEAGASGAELLERLAGDPTVAGLLLIHDLHPDDLESRIRKALARVRPYLDSHGGDVELVAIDAAQGAVRLRMKGSCDGCPSSALTVKLAVQGAIQELAPEIERFEVDGVADAPPRANGHANGNGHAAATAPGWVRIEAPAATASDERLELREVAGASLVLCRVAGRLYAYRASCPGCGAGLGGGRLAGGVLSCPDCARAFDVRRAGRALGDAEGLQLGPVPLLERDTGIDVALAGGAP